MRYILNCIYYTFNNNFTSYNIKMDEQKLKQLETEKIALTKQYEIILSKITRYGTDKALIEKRDKIVKRIGEIKELLNSN